MNQQQITPVQVQMAASAGVELLNIKDLPVPMHIAKTGALAVLDGILQAVARGELVLNPPENQKTPLGAPTPASVEESSLAPPGLDRIGDSNS